MNKPTISLKIIFPKDGELITIMIILYFKVYSLLDSTPTHSAVRGNSQLLNIYYE